jgi:hypothetical protein|tara:strand:+ start:272 stop:451 length:180 start_codon:yes stop_codon:yes gene_type:complete
MHIKTKEKAMQYTLEEIIEAWSKCYGESMQEEYKGFVDYLKNKGESNEKHGKESRSSIN